MTESPKQDLGEDNGRQPQLTGEEVAARLAEFRDRLAGRGLAPAVELLRDSRQERLESLTRAIEGN
jgi:hypothetical protein